MIKSPTNFYLWIILLFCGIIAPQLSVASNFDTKKFLEKNPGFELIAGEFGADSIIVNSQATYENLTLKSSESVFIPYAIVLSNFEAEHVQISPEFCLSLKIRGATIQYQLTVTGNFDSDVVLEDVDVLGNTMLSHSATKTFVVECVFIQDFQVLNSTTGFKMNNCYLHGEANFNKCDFSFFTQVRNHFPGASILVFENCKLNTIWMRDEEPPTRIEFINSKLLEQINLHQYLRHDTVSSIYLESIDITMLVIPFDFAKLSFTSQTRSRMSDSVSTYDDVEAKNTLYLNILAQLKNSNEEQSYKQLNLEYQRFHHLEYSTNPIAPLLYHIERLWWNFGHNKSRILIGTCCILLLLSFINVFLIGTLSEEVYVVQGITKYTKSSAHEGRELSMMSRFIFSFYYTAIIFFGLKMEIRALDFNRYMLVGYLFVIFTTGLVCLAFLANWILTF
jgi:hypothetical protein